MTDPRHLSPATQATLIYYRQKIIPRWRKSPEWWRISGKRWRIIESIRMPIPLEERKITQEVKEVKDFFAKNNSTFTLQRYIFRFSFIYLWSFIHIWMKRRRYIFPFFIHVNHNLNSILCYICNMANMDLFLVLWLNILKEIYWKVMRKHW